MNLKNYSLETLYTWKQNAIIPKVFKKEISNEIKNREKLISKLSDRQKMRLAVKLIHSGVARGRESLDVAKIALKMAQLKNNKKNCETVFAMAYPF